MSDELRLSGFYASAPCMLHELPSDAPSPSRLMPQRPLPSYAYLPGGRFPHPVRDRDGHSYGAVAEEVTSPSLTSDGFRWGADLFNHGYYWEAHEAWEALWRVAERDDSRRALLKGLILMAAAGLKIREGKPVACVKHARRAAALFRHVATRATTLAGLAITPACLARHAEAVVDRSWTSQERTSITSCVFDFVLRLDGAE